MLEFLEEILFFLCYPPEEEPDYCVHSRHWCLGDLPL